jgi:hypothetical protein
MPGQQQRTPRTEQARLVTSKDGRSAWLSAYCCSRSKTRLRLSLLAVGERGEFAAVSDGKRRLETISYWYLGDKPFRGRPREKMGASYRAEEEPVKVSLIRVYLESETSNISNAVCRSPLSYNSREAGKETGLFAYPA